MINRFIIAAQESDAAHDATGTFADGAFPLINHEQVAVHKGHSLRTSYGRDYSLGRKMDQAPSLFA